MKTVLAFDFGASSGRAIKASYNGEAISYSEVHRFDNIPIIEDGHIYHDIDMIKREIDIAIDKAGDVDTLAFDTWGVDYALIDSDGKLIGRPYHYRDTRTQNVLDDIKTIMSTDDLYNNTGNQIMPINTLFQLIVDDNLSDADKILFMPDLFGYLLTGNMVCEYTIASTSQMLNLSTLSWSNEVTEGFSINKNVFPPLTRASTVLGKYRGIDVVTVAGHDTQCAVAAMTAHNEKTAFLSCGTWSLIGCELEKPVLSKKSNALELSNEIGANGKINYLKNISGLWLIQELKRNLAENGEKYSYNDLEMLARDSKPFKCFVDPDAPSLSTHGSLAEKIREYCKKTNQEIPETVGELVRCVYESLALKYRYALSQISECTGKSFELLNMLGGGTKDSFLCEMASSCIGIPVVAGPVEATALGNIILQLIAAGEIDSIEQGRRIVAKSENVKKYMPDHSAQWDKAYEKYIEII